MVRVRAERKKMHSISTCRLMSYQLRTIRIVEIRLEIGGRIEWTKNVSIYTTYIWRCKIITSGITYAS